MVVSVSASRRSTARLTGRSAIITKRLSRSNGYPARLSPGAGVWRGLCGPYGDGARCCYIGSSAAFDGSGFVGGKVLDRFLADLEGLNVHFCFRPGLFGFHSVDISSRFLGHGYGLFRYGASAASGGAFVRQAVTRRCVRCSARV